MIDKRELLLALAEERHFAGLVCNALVKPLAPHWFMKPGEVAALM